MTYRITIFRDVPYGQDLGIPIPSWWSDMLYQMSCKGFDYLSIDDMNLYLLKIDAKCAFSTENTEYPYGDRYLTFESEPDYIAFLLRFS